MKKFIYWKLALILKQLARLTIWKYRPGIVGVTGSAGKTSTKLAIAAVLANDRNVRWSKGNFNNELGLPLAILGDWEEEELRLVSREIPAGAKTFRKLFFWMKVFVLGVFNLLFLPRSGYPEILILEYGADRPGDLKKLLAIARPNVSVITAVGEIPVHVEFFSGPEELAREKARLIEVLPTAGYAVLNHDDKDVFKLKDRTRAQIMTFGFTRGSDVQIIGFENRAEGDRPLGLGFKLNYGGSLVPVRLEELFGKAHAYAAGAASAVGLIFGLNLVKIAEGLGDYRPAHSRMELVPGLREGSWILDDSYNASPLSTKRALETLFNIPAKRRIAVLGDMLEIGKYSLQAHEEIGEIAAKIADVLVTVGKGGKLMAEAARKAGLAKRNIYSFETSEEAKRPVQELIRKGDLVLVKASRGIAMEKVVEEIRGLPN